jgi:integrase
VRRHNLPYATFHSLRHTHVSLLLNEGASLRLIAERVGHSDPSLTLRVYSHLLPGAQTAAAERLDKLIGLG